VDPAHHRVVAGAGEDRGAIDAHRSVDRPPQDGVIDADGRGSQVGRRGAIGWGARQRESGGGDAADLGRGPRRRPRQGHHPVALDAPGIGHGQGRGGGRPRIRFEGGGGQHRCVGLAEEGGQGPAGADIGWRRALQAPHRGHGIQPGRPLGQPPGRQQGPGRGGGRRPQGIARGADLEAAAAAGDHVEVRQADAGGRGIGPVGVARDGGGGGVRRSRDRSTAGDDRQTRTVEEGGLLRTGQEPAGAESQAEGGGDRAGRRRGRQHHPVAGLGDGGKGELEATTEIGAARIEPQGQGPRQGGGDRWNRHGATGRRQTVTVATDRRLAALPSPWQCIAIFRVRKGRRRHPYRGRRPPTLRGSDVTADGRGPRAGGRADDYEPLQR
jgi:hypothetical protein